jgi:hypothetical protein
LRKFARIANCKGTAVSQMQLRSRTPFDADDLAAEPANYFR